MPLTNAVRDIAVRVEQHLSLVKLITMKPGALFKAATRFYALIFEGARHNIAWEIVQRLNGRISRLRVLTLTSDERDMQGPEHMQAICNAITNSDPEAALAAVKAHLNEVKTIARHLLPGNAKE